MITTSAVAAFMNGDTRERTVGISYTTADDEDGNPGYVRVGEFTSSGDTDEFEQVKQNSVV